MKKYILFFIALSFSYLINGQNTYTVNGETYELKTEVEGTLDLLWNVINGEYRYFIKKEDNTVIELTNKKDVNNKYDEAYKATLKNLTQGSNLSTEKLKFTLFSLQNFVSTYNASVDTNYSEVNREKNLNTRILVFSGITNSPFVDNPDNKSNPLFGAEIEVYGGDMPSHSLFFQVKHVLGSDEFDFSTTQLGLGYRYRFIKKNTFNIYANVLAATYNSSKSTFTALDENDMLVSKKRSASSFDIPFIFGVGADIKITENSFVTITYDELFAAFLNNQDNFSTHFAIGYKFNL